MKTQTSRSKKRRKYLRLRKNRAWLSTLIFFLLSIASLAVVVCFAAVFMLFVVNSGVEKEYQAKKQLALLYEAGITDGENPYTVFDTALTDYILKDSSGMVIASKGENTCAEQSGSYHFALDLPITSGVDAEDSELVRVYSDSENPIILPKGSNSVYFDGSLLWQAIQDDAFGNTEETEETEYDADSDETVNIRQIQLPFWESIPVKNGAETLFFKAYIPISPTNIMLVFGMLGVLILLVGIILIGMVIHAISAGLHQRRINKLIFTDLKIKGNNWLWFLLHAEHLLRRRGNARKQFALVDLEFVGYRRFCVCESVDEGEAMLGAVYSRLCKLIGKKELCAHSEEDSFALLLQYRDKEEMRIRLQNILSELGGLGKSHALAFHAGVYPVAAEENAGTFSRRRLVDVEADYNNACSATVSLSGSDGSGIAFYDEKLIEEQRWVETVTAMQQRALENEEFLVYYQPKYDPQTHELRGAEALIRWQSPEYGFLSPYKFIPIFEKNGFITEIDHYMLCHVARAQKQWLDAGEHCVPVSVNVSRAHFIESDLAEQIRDIIDAEGLPHDLIEIELTESAFFDDKKALLDTIVKLKEYGFSVSMDDFGAGYSSLNSLKDMPLDVLKLDADFFRGAAADTDRGEIVISEAIQLAKHLQMRTVAEGVEMREQVEFLAAQGCDMIQGYYFAKPMPAEDYRQRMISGRHDGADNVETASSAG